MARLLPDEFDRLIDELVSAQGLAKLQDKLLRAHAIVSRRRLGSAASLSRQLYQLTGGLERQALSSQVVLALWEELLGSKIDEGVGKELEATAEKINGCLTKGLNVAPERIAELRELLAAYRQKLASRVGETAARLTMLTRAVPDVARLLREP